MEQDKTAKEKSDKLEPRRNSFTIVVLSEQNNPSILNPDFLKEQEIVPRDWPLTPLVICTPQVAQIGYQNGVNFTFNLNSLVITDMAPEGADFPVPDIAIKFLATVPHVKYYALGINFEVFYSFKDLTEATAFTVNKFLNKTILEIPYSIESFQPTLSFNVDDAVCNLSFQKPMAGKVNDEQVIGVFVKGNFHRDYKGIEDIKERNKKISEQISNWKNDDESFKNILNALFGDK